MEGKIMNSLTLFNNKDILDKLFGFDEFLTTPLVKETSDYHKPFVRNLEDKYQISLIAPGLEKKDFNITLEGNQLTVSYDASEKKQTHTYATKYSKSYVIPADVDIENISASYKNGVLLVDLPKQESAKPRTIDIR